MEIWEINLTGKGVCLYFPRWIQRSQLVPSSKRSAPRELPAFKIERKRQNPRKEEVPKQAIVAVEISKKHCAQHHLPRDLPPWRQIKTLTNQAENLVSQQEMPQNPENIFVSVLALLAFALPAQAEYINHTYWAYIPNPFYCRL